MACNESYGRHGWRGFYQGGVCYRIVLPADSNLETYEQMENDSGFRQICGRIDIGNNLVYQGHLAQILTQKLSNDLQKVFSASMSAVVPVAVEYVSLYLLCKSRGPRKYYVSSDGGRGSFLYWNNQDLGSFVANCSIF